MSRHPTPIDIEVHIAKALLEHDRTAEPHERFPAHAMSVIRQAVANANREIREEADD